MKTQLWGKASSEARADRLGFERKLHHPESALQR